MAKLILSGPQLVRFLEQRQFSFMKKIKRIEFTENAVEVKVKVGLNVKVKVDFVSYTNGILQLRASTKSILKDIVKLFFGINKQVDKFLEKKKLDRYIVNKDLDFYIKLNPLLADKLNIKGVEITALQVRTDQLQVDFQVSPVS